MKNNSKMSKIIKYFLKTSPRSKATQQNNMLPKEFQSPINKLPTDQQFIKNFLIHLDISYMYQYYGPITINEHKKYLHSKTFLNPLSNGLVRKKALQINDFNIDKRHILMQIIKQLNKHKYQQNKYIQCQQFIHRLQQSQVKTHKKLLIFIYKWLLTQKHKFQQNSIHKILCHQTCQLILKKIYKSHSDDQLQNAKQQILLIEYLQKARQFKNMKNSQQARQNYQLVYWTRMSEQIDKVQALEYLCEISIMANNVQYLQNMIEMVKENKGIINSHQKIIRRAIKQIKIKNIGNKVEKQDKINIENQDFPNQINQKQSKQSYQQLTQPIQINKQNQQQQQQQIQQQQFFTINNISLISQKSQTKIQQEQIKHAQSQLIPVIIINQKSEQGQKLQSAVTSAMGSPQNNNKNGNNIE